MSDTFKHDYKVTGVGGYQADYKCTKCGDEISVTTDDFSGNSQQALEEVTCPEELAETDPTY